MKVANILISAAVGFGALGLIWWQNSANSASQPVEVKMPTLDAVALEGQALFAKNCATCHGANGGGTGQGPPLIHIIYEPNHHGDASFYAAVASGVRQHHWPFGNMPRVNGVTQEQVGKIIAFIRTVQRANGIQ